MLYGTAEVHQLFTTKPERIVMKGIRFDPPMIIETDAEKNIAVVCVTGYSGDFSEAYRRKHTEKHHQ